MLQFNKLRISGFKSFVDPTELAIELGLTGVVGPNGCGKSNLVEALRWAMGETSAKQMRGKEMDDVIFGGTSDRPARNIAEVTLHLDNKERAAPAQFNDHEDLEVSRRIEREKGSQYRVNGADTRARDVQLLFADSATGARSTAMVSQGRIGAIISAKPTDRRSLLEEAAGITGLHSRRHEAELRLRGAETNLERLDDILVTLDTQLAGLKKQARQANRYRNLSDHIRRAEAALFHLRWVAAEGDLARHREQLHAATAAVHQLTAAAGQAAAKQAEQASGLPDLRQAEAATAAELHRLVVARENIEAEEQRIQRAVEETTERLNQVRSDMERERAFGADATRAVEALNAERAEIETAKQDSAAESTEAAEALRQANQTAEALDTDLSDLTRRIAESDARRTSLTGRVQELDTRLSRLQVRAEQIAEERRSLNADSEAERALRRAEDAHQDAQNALETARGANEGAEAARRQATEKTRESAAALQSASADLTRMEAEESALVRVLAVADEDLWPPLIDAVQVEPGFETALAAALGEDLSAPTDEAAPVHWRTQGPLATAPSLPAGARPLADVVTAPTALARRLAQIGIVETAEDGRRLASELTIGQRLVSRDGGLWRWDGYTISAGAPTATAARLEQRNRLADIRDELDAARAAARTAEQAHATARQAEEQATAKERTAREAVQTAERAYGEARDAYGKLREAAAAQQSRMASLSETAEGIDSEITDGTTQLTAAREELAAMPDSEADREAAEELRRQLTEARTQQSECRARHDGLARLAEERQRRLQAIATEVGSWEQRGAGSAEQLRQLEERQTRLAAELEGLRQRPGELEAKRTDLMERIEGSEERRKQAADALAATETALAEADRVLREAEAALARAREDMVRGEGAVEQANQNCAAITEAVLDRIDCKPEQLLEISDIKDGADLPELEAVERKVERLKRERDTMGPVNLRAEQEATEMVEQITTLNDEREDLLRAIDKLRQGISELNREGRQRLLQSFKEVDGHFQNLFVRLFGGGRAHLALTDSDDPLEAGLEIMASPPGKKLQVLSLLSGGEQALTALALLFAVFLTNPAPICVLDEVDAPLDDANVDRFCTMLEEMTKQEKTRFLIITHHRMTMARMDRLYGVTMSERGVSQLVSVDLQRAEELRDIA